MQIDARTVVVVTGASRGIGLHIARAFHAEGATVVMTGRTAETLRSAAASIGSRCHPIVCDQSSPAAIEKMAQTVLDQLGAPSILVNNAGIYHGTTVAEMSLETWNDILMTNLTGVFLTTKAFLPGMIARERGDIFMISSMSGKKGDPGTGAYNASKFGLQGFSQALNYEVRHHNIRVMVINPSSVDTGRDAGPEYGKGLYLHAADLAQTIVFFSKLPGRTLVRDMDVWGTNPGR